jgi:hypothetical protein
MHGSDSRVNGGDLVQPGQLMAAVLSAFALAI